VKGSRCQFSYYFFLCFLTYIFFAVGGFLGGIDELELGNIKNDTLVFFLIRGYLYGKEQEILGFFVLLEIGSPNGKYQNQ
jgi:hypothetical protein